MRSRAREFHLTRAVPLVVLLLIRPADAAELAAPIQKLLNDRCVECHNAVLKNGGMNLQQLAADFAPSRDEADWVKVEEALVQGKMPPKDEGQFEVQRLRQFSDWFQNSFVMPGGVQHAGASVPRRLTREELQNTLEDILHVDIRVTVTNSRLHVIPDTIIEKFFAAGVRGESGFSNEAATLSREPVNIQTFARCFSLVLSLLDSNEDARKTLLGRETLPVEIDEAEAHRIITRFGKAAFRRPLTEAEAEAFLTVFRTMSRRKTAYESIKSSFLAVLLSPPFLFRFEEPVKADSPESRQAEVTGNELAVRLSYFLWSAPPDKTLLDLAATGELRKPEVLIQQTRRMLDGLPWPKIWAASGSTIKSCGSRVRSTSEAIGWPAFTGLSGKRHCCFLTV